MLLFAGTTEGRLLYEALKMAEVAVDVCVATEYGKEIIDRDSDNIFARRLDKEQMKKLILKNKYELVVDATHPYAVEVTKNIKQACDELSVQYVRLLRGESDCKNVVYCSCIEDAIDFFRHNEGNILSTIGSKELHFLTSLADFEKRVFARILPLPEAVTACFDLGFRGSNLICMQGPFSYELNLAMLKQYECRFLLSKNSGDAGGLKEKIAAAQEASVSVVLIGRPTAEQGLSVEEVTAMVFEKYAPQYKASSTKKRYFPLFTDICNKQILVVGAGKIAERRILTLLKFDCKIKVVAPSAAPKIIELSEQGQIEYINREYNENDLCNAFIAIAATDNRAVNHLVGEQAKHRNIPVSVADCKEECSFFFPAVVAEKDTVIGVTAEGKSHRAAREMADLIREKVGST